MFGSLSRFLEKFSVPANTIYVDFQHSVKGKMEQSCLTPPAGSPGRAAGPRGK